MTTDDNAAGGPDEGTSAPGTGPSPFSEDELKAAVAGPAGDPELDEVESATIDVEEGDADYAGSFDKLVAKVRRLSPEQIRCVVQSVLFVAEAPLSVDQLFEATGIDRAVLEEALGKLQAIHREGLSGIVLHEVAGGWQLRTAPESAEWVRRFLRVKPQRLTRAAVETLAIIAYRQPVTRPELEDIRGVDCGAVLKALLDRKLVKILGKKEEVGRPILYGTTREFLEYFALKDLSALPTLREFHELTEEHQEIVEQETKATPGVQGTLQQLRDDGYGQRLAEADQASEAALARLEAAMAVADDTTRSAEAILKPPPVEPPVAPAQDAAP